MTKDEITKYCEDFSKEYGELLLLRANIAAINTMLIKRGREEELYDAIVKTIEQFKAESNGTQ